MIIANDRRGYWEGIAFDATDQQTRVVTGLSGVQHLAEHRLLTHVPETIALAQAGAINVSRRSQSASVVTTQRSARGSHIFVAIECGPVDIPPCLMAKLPEESSLCTPVALSKRMYGIYFREVVDQPFDELSTRRSS
ncbi:hypothetical protein OG804_19885 [Nocardia sp. NBC_00416]